MGIGAAASAKRLGLFVVLDAEAPFATITTSLSETDFSRIRPNTFARGQLQISADVKEPEEELNARRRLPGPGRGGAGGAVSARRNPACTRPEGSPVPRSGSLVAIDERRYRTLAAREWLDKGTNRSTTQDFADKRAVVGGGTCGEAAVSHDAVPERVSRFLSRLRAFPP